MGRADGDKNINMAVCAVFCFLLFFIFFAIWLKMKEVRCSFYSSVSDVRYFSTSFVRCKEQPDKKDEEKQDDKDKKQDDQNNCKTDVYIYHS